MKIKKTLLFLQKNLRYVMVCILFLLSFLYQAINITKESKKEDKDKEAVETVPTLTIKSPEKVFPNILQAKDGDVFRIGFLGKVDYEQSVDIFLENKLFERLKVGQIDIKPSDTYGQYRELLFSTPGRYDSVVLRLRSTESKEREWDNKTVFIDSFFASRINTDIKGMKHIQSTTYGIENMPNARLEDIGETLLYTFSLTRNQSDYESLFDSTPGVKFDQEDGLITGLKKSGEFFTFRFDTVKPFKKFSLFALRKGVSQDEVRFEYSFDNFFWHDVSPTITEGGQQSFLASLSGDGKTHSVYVRAAYTGEEKKVGAFSFEKLSAVATVEKNFQR